MWGCRESVPRPSSKWSSHTVLLAKWSGLSDLWLTTHILPLLEYISAHSHMASGTILGWNKQKCHLLPLNNIILYIKHFTGEFHNTKFNIQFSCTPHKGSEFMCALIRFCSCSLLNWAGDLLSLSHIDLMSNLERAEYRSCMAGMQRKRLSA